MSCKIILWGTGIRVQGLIKQGYFEKCIILGFIDTYKSADSFMGYKVYYPKDVRSIEESIDYIVIANQYFAENLEQCIELGLDWDKIALAYNVQEPLFYKKFLNLKYVSEKLFTYLEDRAMRLIKINESDQRDVKRFVGKSKYESSVYTKDYFRYRTFEFLAREILKNNIEGSVAEVGVFRGAFAAIINEIFKDKRLYLFDTFEGFSKEEAEKEVNMGRCDVDFVTQHKDSSVHQLLKILPYPEKCKVCKGMFPDSVSEEASNDKYVFVSLDVDFEESTYQGLKFFYPRLSEGGAIFVHDYNTFYLEGVKCAIQRFEKDFAIKLKKIPLADRAGTLVIVK